MMALQLLVAAFLFPRRHLSGFVRSFLRRLTGGFVAFYWWLCSSSVIALWLLSDSFSTLCCSLFISSLQPFWFPDVGLEAPRCSFFSSTMLSLQLFTIGPFVAPDFCSAGERSPRKAYAVAEKIIYGCGGISSRLQIYFFPFACNFPPARKFISSRSRGSLFQIAKVRPICCKDNNFLLLSFVFFKIVDCLSGRMSKSNCCLGTRNWGMGRLACVYFFISSLLAEINVS